MKTMNHLYTVEVRSSNLLPPTYPVKPAKPAGIFYAFFHGLPPEIIGISSASLVIKSNYV
jgi:hypothetical protein